MNPELTYTPILGLPNTPKMNAPYVTTHKGGVEFSLNWNDRIGDFTYRVGANYTHWEEVTVRHADKSTDYYYANLNDLGVNAHAETYNISWQTNGIFTSYDDMYNSYLHFKRNHTVGTFRMDDRNGDGVLGIADYAYNTGGGTTPQTLYGITLGAGWKDFSFRKYSFREQQVFPVTLHLRPVHNRIITGTMVNTCSRNLIRRVTLLPINFRCQPIPATDGDITM